MSTFSSFVNHFYHKKNYLVFSCEIHLLNCTKLELFFHCLLEHGKKKVGIQFHTAFFVHILLLYQISTYTSLYTRIFSFSHSYDFHIPLIYQNIHIPTTYQNLLHIPAVYQSVKIPFLFFAVIRHFLGEFGHISWIFLHI